MSRVSVALCLICLLVGSAALPGCGGSNAEADSPLVRRVRVQNKTSDVVRDVVVTGLGRPITFSPISGGSESSLAPTDGSISRPIYVRWTDAQKQTQHLKINLKRRLGEQFRGTVVLTFRSVGVEVSES